MIRCTPANLRRETDAARKFRDVVLSCWDEMIAEYVGPGYGSIKASPDRPFTPESHAFEYLSLVVPMLVYDIPRFKARTRRGGDFRWIAQAMEHGLNRLAADVRMRDVIREVVVDACLAFGVIHVTLEPRGPQDIVGARTRPRIERIPPRSWFCDPLATTRGAARLEGHEYAEDIETLIARAEADPSLGWDVEGLRALQHTQIDEPERIGRPKIQADAPERNEVLITEVWVPEKQMDGYRREDGYHGTIYTLIEGSDESDDSAGDEEPDPSDPYAGFLRAPRPYYGPPDGPYNVMGVYTVPDRPYPLGPIQATRGPAKQLNDTARAIDAGSRSYKRIVLVSAAASSLKEALASGEHDHVIPIPSLKADEWVQVEVGGITDQMMAARQVFRDALDRASGINEAQRGNVTGRASATENAIANEGAAKRLGYVQQQVAAAVGAAAGDVAWFMWHTDSVIFSLGEESANTMGAVDPVFVGGSGWVTGYTFEDLEIELEPHSMARVSEAQLQANTMRAVELTINAAPAMRQFPELAWTDMFRILGASLNIPMEKWINPEASAMLLGLTQPIVQPEPIGRLAGDRAPGRGSGMGTGGPPPGSPGPNPQRNSTQQPAPSPRAITGAGSAAGAMP